MTWKIKRIPQEMRSRIIELATKTEFTIRKACVRRTFFPLRDAIGVMDDYLDNILATDETFLNMKPNKMNPPKQLRKLFQSSLNQ